MRRTGHISGRGKVILLLDCLFREKNNCSGRKEMIK